MTRPIGARLRAMREDAGYTRDHVAHRLHVAKTTVTNWELGYRQPTYDVVERFCRAIGATIHIRRDLAPHTEPSSREE